jgi:hypothetical protein
MGSAQAAAGGGRGRTEVEERGLADVGQADEAHLHGALAAAEARRPDALGLIGPLLLRRHPGPRSTSGRNYRVWVAQKSVQTAAEVGGSFAKLPRASRRNAKGKLHN